MSVSVWDVLAVEATNDERDIKRAYARRLKLTNPEDDPDGFQQLRGAYEHAVALARRGIAFQTSEEVFDADDDEDAFEEAVAYQPTPRAYAEVFAEPAAAPPPVMSRPAQTAGEETVFAEYERERRESEAMQAQRDAQFAEVREACRLLGEAVTGELDRGAETVERLGRDLLAHPALEDLTLFAQVDRWMAELIVYNVPRADPLVNMALERFDWRSQVGQIHATPFAEHIVQRASDLEYLARVRRKGHAFAKGAALLSATPRPTDWRWRVKAMFRADEVKSLLSDIDRLYPNVALSLDQEALTWWRNYLNSPQIGMATVMIGVGLAAVGALAGLTAGAGANAAAVSGVEKAVAILAGLLVAGGGWAALIALIHYGFRKPRHWWTSGGHETANDRQRHGWAPASLGVLVLSGLIPPSLPGALVLAFLALGPLLWSIAVGDLYRRGTDMGDRIGHVVVPNIYLAALAVPAAILAGGQTLAPALAAGIAFGRCAEPLARLWASVTQATRLQVLGGAAVLLLAGVGTGLLARSPYLGGLATALIATAALLQRPGLLEIQQKQGFPLSIGLGVAGTFVGTTVVASLPDSGFKLAAAASVALVLACSVAASIGRVFVAQFLRDKPKRKRALL